MTVPPQVSGDALSVSGLLAIDKICRQCEAEFEAERKPQIEDFLGETPDPQRSELRRELEAIQREHGQKPERHVTLAQFVQNLVASGLMNEDRVRVVLDEQPPNQRPQNGDELAKLLHRQGRLTQLQARAVCPDGTDRLCGSLASSRALMSAGCSPIASPKSWPLV